MHRERNAGREGYSEYPDMEVRGKEFFVRAAAQVMDETGMSRDQVETAIYAQVDALSDPQVLTDVMPGCLLLLDASGI